MGLILGRGGNFHDQLTLFEYVIIAVYLVFVLLLGLWNGRNVKNLNDYAVADRS